MPDPLSFSAMANDPAGRLQRAMEHRGVATMADLARLSGIPQGTVRQQIGRGSLPKAAAEIYANKLRVPVVWLLYGKGPNPLTGAAELIDAGQSIEPDIASTVAGALYEYLLESNIKVDGARFGGWVTKLSQGARRLPNGQVDRSFLDGMIIATIGARPPPEK